MEDSLSSTVISQRPSEEPSSTAIDTGRESSSSTVLGSLESSDVISRTSDYTESRTTEQPTPTARPSTTSNGTEDSSGSTGITSFPESDITTRLPESDINTTTGRDENQHNGTTTAIPDEGSQSNTVIGSRTITTLLPESSTYIRPGINETISDSSGRDQATVTSTSGLGNTTRTITATEETLSTSPTAGIDSNGTTSTTTSDGETSTNE